MPHTTRYELSALQRESGAFAMLAVDQREALRAMLAEHQADPVTDEQVIEFKLQAARVDALCLGGADRPPVRLAAGD